jgi:hypothetical protein
MALLINFKDAVDASVLDPAATAAVYYYDGPYANRTAAAERCPHAKLYGITVRGATGPQVFACDSETGDLTIAETIAWVGQQVVRDVWPIVVYANQDRWLNLGLLDALAHYGDRIERWDADYDGSTAIPSWASAKQYATGSVDLDVARASFFTRPPPPDPMHYDWYPERILHTATMARAGLNERLTVQECDRLAAHPVRNARALRGLRADCAELAARLETMAEASGDPAKFLAEWHRDWRRRMLDRRAAGQRIAA